MFETPKQRIDALKRQIPMNTIEHYYIVTNNLTLVGVKWADVCSDCGKEKKIAW